MGCTISSPSSPSTLSTPSTSTQIILKNCSMTKQYQRCEELIVKQVQRMIDIFSNNESINIIEEQIDSKIIKECYPWSQHMNYIYWSKFGYDNNGKDIGLHDSIRKYIKKHGYADKYDIDIPEEHVILNTNTNTSILIMASPNNYCNLYL